MHIALIGPCAPLDLEDLLDEDASIRARSFPGYRGIAVSVLARELVKRGHRVSVVSASYEGIEHSECFHGTSLTIHVVPGRTRARARAKDLWLRERQSMTTVLQKINPDVVHAHWTYEFALAALASGLPTLVTIRDAPLTILRYYHDPYRAIRLILAIWVRAKQPQMTAVSGYMAEQWRREMGWRRDIAIIPNIAPFEPGTGEHKDPPAHRVVTVADSSRRKNVRAALRAWPLVLQAFPDAELHLIGYGLGPLEDLALWAKRQALERQIVWHGHVERAELEDLIGSATALLHPSLEESLGNTLLEAMALSVPVVGGSQSGAVPWTVGGGGIMTDVRSPTAIAATVVDLLGDPERCARLGITGRQRVTSVFSPDAVTSAYEEQYTAMLAEVP